MKKADLFFNVLRVPVDFLMLLLAGLAAYVLRTSDLLTSIRPVMFRSDLLLLDYLSVVALVAPVFMVAYAISGLYSMKFRMTKMEEFLRIIVASSAGILLVIVFIFLRQELFNSRFLVLGAWALAVIFISLGRLLIRYFQHVAVGRFNFGIQRLVLIGEDGLAAQMKADITDTPSTGYRILAHWSRPQLDELRKMSATVDEVLLVSPNYEGNHIAELVDFCHENHIVFKFVPNLYQTLTKHVDIDLVSNVPVIELKRTPLDGWGRVFKRTIDIVGASLGLIICSPLFAATAVAIQAETKGPVFISLSRVSGKNQFKLYKFRSMIAHDPDGGAESLKASLTALNERQDGPLFKMKNDPRVTKVGRFIRGTRIDELPQLWNVLKGDISLVGPRPHQPDEIARYEKHHKKVLAIKAGATGLAQVSGSSDLPFDQEVAMDSFYIDNWSLFMDIKIIFKTMFKMLHDRSAV
ncbi:MAG TPA: sugar transferase [Candidatus Paceibacterota bacterium]|nr:sugar transferase [Candidatus Paceibacterota bacterium]